MTVLHRSRVAFSNFLGGPGVATMYFLDTTTAVASLETLWTGLATAMPGDVRISIEPGGDSIEDTTGDLVGAWTADPVALINGTSGGYYSAPTGLAVDWITGSILDGHRVRGRTFVVPCGSSLFNTAGTLSDATLTAIRGYANEFIIEQSSSFVIWHRPYAGREATPKLKAKAAHAGAHALVTSSTVSANAAVLRSRRD